MKQQRVVELVAEDGPPIWDFRIHRFSDSEPARFLEVHCRVERGKVVSNRPAVKIVTCITFLVDPDLPEEERRVGLLLPGGNIPDELAADAVHLGTFLHPANGAPMSLFEFPWTPLEPEVGAPDALAAITAVRDREEQGQ